MRSLSSSQIVNTDTFSSVEAVFKKRKVVLVGGCFDVFHYGHLKFLQAARNHGDALVIALESDEAITQRKKRKPVHTQKERAEILASLHIADVIIMLDYLKTDEEYFKLVRLIRPSVIAVTEGDSQIENKQKQATAIGSRVEVVTPIVKDLSTTKIIHYADVSGN
jgi:rfaE bifunctional protein nucleotidyltransferase chain/domain